MDTEIRWRKRKRCTKCILLKENGEFGKDKRALDGKKSQCLMCSREYAKKILRECREHVINALGGKCWCCGEKMWEFLAIDHINGGGREDRELFSRSFPYHKHIINQGIPKDKYRVLCHNCNMAIGTHGFCPHDPNRTRKQQ